MPTVQPVISTPDLSRLLDYYQRVFDAVESDRYPREGEPFFVNLRVGDSELGLVSQGDAGGEAPPRILLSVAVDDVDGRLPEVTAAGGRVLGPPNDMPWGQRVAHTLDPDGNLVNLTRSV
ncbi:VOC family protein [Plantactinospora siamensis]|uniref:VOC family protein n=1 Tax=Plantactinospora siamensis TaxID=555372 RepID=A0ABV6NRI4_9ACTN